MRARCFFLNVTFLLLDCVDGRGDEGRYKVWMDGVGAV